MVGQNFIVTHLLIVNLYTAADLHKQNTGCEKKIVRSSSRGGCGESVQVALKVGVS